MRHTLHGRNPFRPFDEDWVLRVEDEWVRAHRKEVERVYTALWQSMNAVGLRVEHMSIEDVASYVKKMCS
jgi:hypothetical protein